LPALFWWSNYVISHHLVVMPQSGAKEQVYCTVYYITLNSNCEANRAFQIYLKSWEIELEAKINALVI